MWFAGDEEEDRFAYALLASILLHAFVLGQVRSHDFPRPAGSAGPLSVSFRGPPTAVEASPQPPLPPVVPAATAVLVQKIAPVTMPASPVREVQPAAPPEVAGGKPKNGRDGAPRPKAGRAFGIVDVVMLIGSDGHPHTLIWDSLPALTQEQFDRLERAVRRQVYASSVGARLTQEINVFALIGQERQPSPGSGSHVSPEAAGAAPAGRNPP